MIFLYACALLLTQETISQKLLNERVLVCVDLAAKAIDESLDPSLMISIAWVESRFDPKAISRAGAIGVLQILPRYFCPNRSRRGCDTIKAGFKAWRAWRQRSPSDVVALCRYNAGNRCTRQGKRYARTVIRARRLVRRNALWQTDRRFRTILGGSLLWRSAPWQK